MKQTSLYEHHIAQGARIFAFAGWSMPLQYKSLIEEHLSVRKAAGLFDVSHMGKILLEGTGQGGQALAFLQKLTCNDIEPLKAGQAQYNLVLNDEGGVVDDIVLYRLASDRFFLVSNAANHEKLLSHLRYYAKALEQGGASSEGLLIQDISQNYEQLALQGPQAQNILEKLLQRNLDHIGYFHFEDLRLGARRLRLSRSGYTGEDGFEIYAQARSIVWLWESLLREGSPWGLVPCGLGARDSLRMEAAFPLYGKELNAAWSPCQSALSWAVKEKDPPYLAYEHIMRHKKQGAPGKVTGFRLKAAALARSGAPVWDANRKEQIAQTLSAVYSPVLKTGIGSLYLPSSYKAKEVQIEVRGRFLDAELHSGPFVAVNSKSRSQK